MTARAATAGTHRIVGLDAWRTALMLGGLLLHGSMLKEPSPAWDIINLVSSSFRMGTFFAISGLLAGFTLARRAPDAWLARQMVRIGVPAFFGLIVLCPIIAAMLRHGLPADQSAGVLTFDWHHLWFLFALIVYQPIGWVIATWDDRRMLARRIIRWRRGGAAAILCGTALVAFLLMVAATPAIFALAPEAWWAPLIQIRLILGYAPLYLLGFTVAGSRSVRVMLLADRHTPWAMLVGTGLLYLLWHAILAPRLGVQARANWESMVHYAGSAVAPPAVFALALRSAASMRTIPALVQRLCAASFTIYLLHYPALIAVNLWATGIAGNMFVEYALAMTIAGSGCYAFHVLAVERVPILSFLLNGRMPRATSMEPMRAPA